MDRNSDTHPDVSGLKINDLVSYLRRNQWRAVSTRNKRLLLFHGPDDDDGNPVELVLTADDRFRDAPRSLSQAIDLLAAVQQRSRSSVIDSILFRDKDVVNARILGESAESGSIPLPVAQSVLEHLRSNLSYAARLEERPDPFFPGVSKQAKQFVGRCRFGQTFMGSFGFRIEIPLPAPIPVREADATGLSQFPLFESGEIVPAVPLERKVALRFFRGLSRVRDSVEKDDVNILLTGYGDGFNGNVYENLEGILLEFPWMEFMYSMTWSPDWPVPSDVDPVSEIPIRRSTLRYVKTAARELRRVVQPEETEIGGRIVQLKAETVPEDDDDWDLETSECTVVIRRDEPGEKPSRVTTHLSPDDYKKACDAHKEGRTVRVKGRLDKPGKSWILQQPTDFMVE
ncbi:MAG: hypothetical protein AB1646_05160 [Thermodesulfobacteriota bacterium]